MSFDPAWLDLRAPADRAARDPGLRAAALAWLDAEPTARVVDLGCGSGALWRDFERPGLRWRLVDNDPGLLDLAAQRCPGAETAAADLADLAALPLAGARLVTASALLDLASAAWLDGFAARLSAGATALYACLSYDGAMDWTPPEPGDAAILAAFNAHQTRDKGLGPALGPRAADHLTGALAALGFTVHAARSPWRLAVCTVKPSAASALARWAAARGPSAAPSPLSRV